MRRARRLGSRATAFGLWGLVILLVGGLVGTGTTAGQEPSHAGLVITDAEGDTETSCIEFAEEEITGAELLRRSGLSVVYTGSGGFGEGVCSIDGTGCNDPGDCFCRCRGADCAYWAYFSRSEGGWRFQPVGASQRSVRDGDVDGWVWGSGSEPPPQVSFATVCPLDAAPTSASDPAAGEATVGPVATGEPIATQERVLEDQDEPSVAEMTAEGALAEQRQALGQEPASDAGGAVAEAEEESSGGAPFGLIAFGVVAAALAAMIGGILQWRRWRG